MKKIKNLFQSFDFFGVNIGFNINRKKQYGTMLGGIVFLLYILVTCYFIIINFISFIDRSIFNQNTIENTLNYSQKLDISNQNIVYAFGIKIDKKVNLSYSNFIQMTVNHITHFTINNTKVISPIKVTQCTKQHFNNLIDEKYDLLSLSDYMCIDKTSNNMSELIIKGLYTEDVFQYIEYSAIAGPDAELDQTNFLKFFNNHDLQLQFYYLDTGIDLSNFHKPSSLYLNSLYIQLSYATTSKLNIDVVNNTFENDANILFRSQTTFNYYTVIINDQLNTYIGFDRMVNKTDEYNLFARIYIRSSNLQHSIRRVYQKLTECLADATSIVSHILMILKVILRAYDKFRAIDSVINRITRYKEKLIKKSPNEFKLLKELFNNQTIDGEAINQDKGEKETPQSNRLLTGSSANNEIHIHPESNQFINVKPYKSLTRNTIIETTSIPNNNFFSTINETLPTPCFTYLKTRPIYSIFLPDKLKQCDFKTKNHNKKELIMRFSFCDMLKFVLFKIGIKSNIKYKAKLFQKGSKYYSFNLDLFTYFTKMREIDLLKYLLFNNHNASLINFISKPSVSYHYSELDSPICNYMNDFTMTFDNIEKISDAYKQTYDQYKDTNSTNKTSEKLLQQTSYELYQLIHE